jgi:hypothetical protein
MIDWDAVVIGPLMGVFGEPATYMPLAGGSFPITVVFDDAYLKEAMFEDGSSGVVEVSACIGVQLSQFTADPLQNDQLFIPANPAKRRLAATYIVRKPMVDSRGAARLLLSRASYP